MDHSTARRWRSLSSFTTCLGACLVALSLASASCDRPAAQTEPDGTLIEGPGVTGLGGIFFKSDDPDSLRRWYREHLGIESAEWGGHAFQWREDGRPDETGYTVWGPFQDSTEYFEPSEHPFMLNYRVTDLPALMDALRERGVQIVGEIEEHPNGRFAWILDPEGRKIELWEPVPSKEDPYLQ